MSGKIFRVPKEERAPAFRIRFDLGSHHLIFSDRIGLGRLTWLPAQGDTAHSTLQWFQAKRLGDEPWPAHRSGSWWKQRCDSRSPIHTVLIDQRRVAGIGNILALEGLFRAGIHPATKANLLSLEEWNQLAAGIHHSIALSHRQHQRARANQLHHNPEGYRGELDFVSEGHIRAEGYVIYGRKNEPAQMWGIAPSGKAKRTADVLVPAVSTFQGLSTSLLHQAKIKVLLPFCCSIPRLQRKGI